MKKEFYFRGGFSDVFSTRSCFEKDQRNCALAPACASFTLTVCSNSEQVKWYFWILEIISYLYISFTSTVVVLIYFPWRNYWCSLWFVVCFFFRPENDTFCNRSPKCFHSKLCMLTVLSAQMQFYQGFVNEKTEFITVLINLECKLH